MKVFYFFRLIFLYRADEKVWHEVFNLFFLEQIKDVVFVLDESLVKITVYGLKVLEIFCDFH